MKPILLDGSCDCQPPDVIEGGDAGVGKQDVVLVWDNGNATATDFDYIMADFYDPAITETDDRIALGGDADPSDDEKDILTFEQWLEKINKLNVYNGGSAEEKAQLENSYILYMGGSATSNW